MPGHPPRPDAPKNVLGTPLGAGRVRLQSDTSARAEHYQFSIKVGTAALFTKLDSQPLPDQIVENLPAGSPVEIIVTASNTNGTSHPTDPVTATVQ